MLITLLVPTGARRYSGHGRLLLAPSLACVVLLLALLPRSGLAQSVAERFSAATSAYAAGRFEEALEVFVELAAEVEDPGVWYRIALCRDRLGQTDEAIAAFERWLASDSGGPEVRREVSARLAELRGAQETERSESSGRIAFEGLAPATRVSIDGAMVTPDGGGEVEVPPGLHSIGFGAAGHEPKTIPNVEVRANETTIVDARLRPALSEPSPDVATSAQPENADAGLETAAWTTLGVGLAALVGGGVAFGLGEVDHAEIRDSTGYGELDRGVLAEMSFGEAERLRDRGNDRKTAGYVLGGVGGAAVLSSIVLFVVDAESAAEPPSAALSAAIGEDQCRILLSGSF